MIQNKPAAPSKGRRFLQLTAALGAVLLLGATASAGPNQIWAATVSLTGGASIAPSPRVLAIDGTGASYTVGYGDSGPGTPAAAYIVKLDNLGNFVWLTSLSALGLSSQAQFTDGIIDTNGELIATGFVDEAATPSIWVTVKIDPATGAGSTTWPDVGNGVGVRVISSVGSDRKGWRCLPDSGGGVYVSGANSAQFLIARYDGSGNLNPLWFN